MKNIILGLIILIPTHLMSQGCGLVESPDQEYSSKVNFAQVEVGWYPEWIESGHSDYPESLPLMKKWQHPYMKDKYASAMHEDSHASDVSNFPGPTMENVEVQYFHSLQKGKGFSGMCPSFAFIDDSTVITPSFGRAGTSLLLLDVQDTIHVLDSIKIPGRDNSALDLATKKARMQLFRETYGGAYFYLSGTNRVYVPGANDNIFRIAIQNRKFDSKNIESINLGAQIRDGNLLDADAVDKEQLNRMTAVMPDSKGNVWFTSKFGIVGLIHREDKYNDTFCPKVYVSFIGYYGARKKIEMITGEIVKSEDLPFYVHEGGEFKPEYRQAIKEKYMIDYDSKEEIQNSFTVGEDGVYIVSNFALYKLHFNEETKQIEMDPKWHEAFDRGDLIYSNDFTLKPGHLNRGSGTTPTLVDNRFVAICDNDTSQINICIYSQEDGSLISKHKIFKPNGSAVENSIVAYDNSLIVGNTYGYVDPFNTNDTPGGIMRFDYNETKKQYEQVKDWPAAGLFDAKTATPKMSAKSGLIYVYNRSDSSFNGHNDWQLTAIDYRTGYRVFYIRPYFEKKEFKDNIGLVLKAFSMGNKNYDKKVFNNIWATYTFGPNNSIYIGTYRGFTRFKSD